MASRFWVTQPVSGAIVSVASAPQIRLTVSSTTGMTTGDVRTVFNVGGTTEANGTWTITVIDGTHIDLQGTTFTNLYTSGGSVNGKWDATNTNNWVTTTGGTNYGQTVPGAADTVTLDGSSGGGTVTVNANLSVSTLTVSAFTGTLDFSANNNNITLGAISSWVDAATGVHTTNMGNGTWTFSATAGGTIINLTASANHTLNANGSTILLSAVPTGARTISLGGKTVNNFTVTNAAWQSFGIIFSGASTGVIGGNLTITNVGFVQLVSAGTLTITGTFTYDGNLTNQGAIFSTSLASTVSVGSTNTLSWLFLSNVTKAGAGSITVNNGFDGGGNTSITINNPSVGTGSRGIIGG